MSVLKTSAIQSPDSDTPQILLSASGMTFSASALEATGGTLNLPETTTIAGDTIVVANDLTTKLDIVAQQTNRNVLYNGAMQVAQRGVSASSLTASGYRTADRWNMNISSFGTWTQSVENDGPTQVGLRKSLKMLCTSANASPAGSNVVIIEQRMEGQDIQRFAKGTASAKTMTLSFWVKSNVTGTAIARLSDIDNSRHVSLSYTINTSATWEKKSLTFPADTSGLFDNDNDHSLSIQFYLGAGSDFTTGTLATTWAADTPANRAVGQVNVGANVNNYWQITGVQLEAGSVATEFEFKAIGQELANCQRYFRVDDFYGMLFGNFVPAGTNEFFTSKGILNMRSVPTLTFPDGFPTNVQRGGFSWSTATAANLSSQNTLAFYLTISGTYTNGTYRSGETINVNRIFSSSEV